MVIQSESGRDSWFDWATLSASDAGAGRPGGTLRPGRLLGGLRPLVRPAGQAMAGVSGARRGRPDVV